MAACSRCATIAAHVASMEEHGIGAIDLVVVNLYPFAQTVAKGAERDEIIENIDIGGPSMVRSAAKNHAHVAIVTDPADYAADRGDRRNAGATLDFRRRLAAKAFAATAAYDSMIASWFAFADQGETFPRALRCRSASASRCAMARTRTSPPRCICPPLARRSPSTIAAGPGQGAVLQQSQRRRCRARAGRRIPRRSADRGDRQARQSLRRRHGETLIEAYGRGWPATASRRSAASSRSTARSTATAEAISGIFTEVVAAPDADEDALAVFAKKKNLRLLLTGPTRPTRRAAG
jgi:phosphoribosylaminoimidazolecarboxamide formyltransferase/IMP cyclohydrolase